MPIGTSTTRTSTTRASKTIDLVSNNDLETDSLVTTSFKKRSHLAVYIRNSKRTKQRKNKTLRETAVGFLSILQFFSFTSYENEQGEDDNENNNEDDNNDDNKDDNEGMTEKEKKIADAIEFVNKVICEEKLSEAEKAFAEVIGGGPWFAKCVRKWPNISMKGELIQHFRGKFPSKSLLNDELVSLKLAIYLRFQKFQINPISVKNYVKQQIIPQLDVVAYHQVFFQKVSEYEQLMSKWYNEDYKIRTYLLLANKEKEHIWITHDKFTFYVNDGPCAI
ncbi:37272_t:CDS:2 [Gigaspora margarita]|uniref:37272_t:CDS:1 n=1 Tax=Gigaspora margarita TaxID=4874 RepID=A0ABN7VLR3_GIGMA|nr:37272_t:CDS:2 [Gigaspora margarita]